MAYPGAAAARWGQAITALAWTGRRGPLVELAPLSAPCTRHRDCWLRLVVGLDGSLGWQCERGLDRIEVLRRG